MTKAQEMALFDEFAAKFGRDSYLGPWLQSIRADVDRSIRCDIYPMPDLPDEAYRKGEAARVRAMTITPDVSRSRRCTIPGREASCPGNGPQR